MTAHRRTTAILAASLSVFATAACENTSSVGGTGAGGGGTTAGTGGGGGGETPPWWSRSDKVDLVFVVDNSRSMTDKQEILAQVLGDLVQGLVNPPCLTNGVFASQPSSGNDVCPEGSQREVVPVRDMHIGVLSSSLGNHGAPAGPCIDAAQDSCGGGMNTTANDKGHLLSRKDAFGSNGYVPTYQDRGFLAWDAELKFSPPGESDVAALVDQFEQIVVGVGQVGCGFEAPLESWYRFLVDPEPYDSIAVEDKQAVPSGLDNNLLLQRAQFLRPDSLLAIVVLSDENDCSTKEMGVNWNMMTTSAGYHLPKARAICATSPNDPCCASCFADQPAGCPDDPTCADDPDPNARDQANLRCFDQKRRFGIDFLYPTDRYVQALSSPTVPNRAGELVPNPLFMDLDPTDDVSTIRDPGLVVIGAIAGVPWQDIARDPTDLSQGNKSAQELQDSNTWALILGDPENGVPPLDPFMIESSAPRSGVNPVTGDAIAPPSSPLNGNPINGHEYTNDLNDDLQFACVFPLLFGTETNCDDDCKRCDCIEAANDLPLCMENPAHPGDLTLQVKAKAYPTPRELRVIQGAGQQGVLASICPSQGTDPMSPVFAYRPFVGSLLHTMKAKLVSAP